MKKNQLIPTHNNIPIIDVFTSELRTYLPLTREYQPVISEKEQQDLLNNLTNNIDPARFIFLIDGISVKIKFSTGIKEVLGYSDEDFTVAKWLEITHPSHVIPHWMFGSAMWKLLDTHREMVKFHTIISRYTTALKHADGHYIYFSCDSFIFQFSKELKAMEFGYVYKISKNFDAEDWNFSLVEKAGIKSDMMTLLIQLKKENFYKKKFFTHRQMQVLKSYANYNEKTIESIAETLKVKKRTVEDYNTEIIKRAKNYFKYDFSNAKEVAQYLKRLQLI